MMLYALYKAKFNKSIIWNKFLLYINFWFIKETKHIIFNVFQFFHKNFKIFQPYLEVFTNFIESALNTKSKQMKVIIPTFKRIQRIVTNINLHLRIRKTVIIIFRPGSTDIFNIKICNHKIIKVFGARGHEKLNTFVCHGIKSNAIACKTVCNDVEKVPMVAQVQKVIAKIFGEK